MKPTGSAYILGESGPVTLYRIPPRSRPPAVFDHCAGVSSICRSLCPERAFSASPQAIKGTQERTGKRRVLAAAQLARSHGRRQNAPRPTRKRKTSEAMGASPQAPALAEGQTGGDEYIPPRPAGSVGSLRSVKATPGHERLPPHQNRQEGAGEAETAERGGSDGSPPLKPLRTLTALRSKKSGARARGVVPPTAPVPQIKKRQKYISDGYGMSGNP